MLGTLFPAHEQEDDIIRHMGGSAHAASNTYLQHMFGGGGGGGRWGTGCGGNGRRQHENSFRWRQKRGTGSRNYEKVGRTEGGERH